MEHRNLILMAMALCASACAAGFDRVEPAEAPRPTRAEAAPAAPLEPSEPPIPASPTWIGAAPSHTVVAPGAGGPVWIGIWIGAPEQVSPRSRPPLSLALLVDTSGSMAGPKIENARLAATSLLEGLAPGDQVSIDAFSDQVRSIAPPTLVSPAALGPLFEAVRGLNAMGGTNLYDGLRAGAAHAASSRAHPLRRVIVISDGLANVGPSRPEDLGLLAARGTEEGVQVSAIGVGLDYDERTLGELSRRSSGRLYHLEDPAQLAAILDQEVRLLGSTVATGAFVEVSAAEGVKLEGAAFADARATPGGLRIPIGALHAGQRRELLVRARVQSAAAGERAIAGVRLVYQDRAGDGRWRSQDMEVRATLGSDARAAEASADARVQAIVARHEGAEAQRRAAALMSRGRRDDAVMELQKGADQVLTAARRADDPAERARLTAQAARMSQSRERFQQAKTSSRSRALTLESYHYSFADDGLAAPPSGSPAPPPPRPPPADKK